MSRLVRIAGNHRMAVAPVREGRQAGRYFLAFEFFGKWRIITDEDTGEMLTWKTPEEAWIVAETWRSSWDDLKHPDLP
ncbi:MAG TPA: hypothetical protein VKQ36_05195 [Ktedonobacterales bacterium]|nr:hypothetical protein [Ktedonobacterales bacterium]